jgi:sigma-B regulation protein RsbU (phosphoserine phosphatase)
LAATGYSPEEYAADPYLWMNMVHPEDQEIVRRLISATLRRERPSGAEHRIRRKDGKIRWVRSTIVPYYDDAGALVRYDGLVEDITERKRAEQRFGRLLESAPDAMVAVDQDGRIVLTNLQAEQAFGYGREELLGQQVEILLPERFRAWHPQHRAEYVANPSIRPIGTMRELSALRKDGSEFPVEIMLSFLETEEGMLISSAIRDITERKRMERSLQEREAQLLAARRIQERLLPQRPPQVRPFEIAGTSRPADFVGGDYFDYFPLPDGSVGIVIADVTGHGLPAALLASSIRTLLRSLANHHREITEIFALANSVLLDETEEDLFVTALLGRLDCQTRSFAYASAGHPTAYLLDAAGEVKACLESTGPPLAVLGQVDFPIGGRFTLQPGDVLLLVTDGVVEARSTDGEPFGTQRMLEVVRRRRHSAAGEIVAALSEEVCTFVQPGQLADDVTAVVIKAGSD